MISILLHMLAISFHDGMMMTNIIKLEFYHINVVYHIINNYHHYKPIID